MDYREALIKKINTYYTDAVQPYQTTIVKAMKDGRKLGLFKKRDFSGHIANFKKHLADAKSLGISEIEIPEEDAVCRALAETFEKSKQSFCLLCDLNAEFFELTDKKQYKNSGVNVDTYTAKFGQMQSVLERAMKDIDALSKEYDEYTADSLAN